MKPIFSLVAISWQLLALPPTKLPAPTPDQRPTVYVFLSTECPISQQYARRLSDIHHQYAADVRFVALFPLRTDTANRIQQFRQEYGLSFRGQPDRAARVAHRLGARVTPEAVVVDAGGRVHYRGAIDDWYVALGKHRPSPTQHYLRDALDALLTDRAVLVPNTEAVGCLIES